jgi:hypothetical protein
MNHNADVMLLYRSSWRCGKHTNTLVLELADMVVLIIPNPGICEVEPTTTKEHQLRVPRPERLGVLRRVCNLCRLGTDARMARTRGGVYAGLGPMK